MRVVDPVRDEKGWRFTLDEGGVDPVTGASYVMELYRRSDPAFEGRATVPFVWDTKTERIVDQRLPADQPGPVDASGRRCTRRRRPDLYPEHAAARQIDAMAEANFHAVNNGVYKAGFATTPGRPTSRRSTRCSPGSHALDEHLADRALPGRRPAHRGRRPAVHDAGPLRRRLPRPLQVQRAQAHRVRAPVAVRPRPVPDPRVRRHHRHRRTSRAHYYGTHEQINPTRIVPKGPGPGGLGGALPGASRAQLAAQLLRHRDPPLQDAPRRRRRPAPSRRRPGRRAAGRCRGALPPACAASAAAAPSSTASRTGPRRAGQQVPGDPGVARGVAAAQVGQRRRAACPSVARVEALLARRSPPDTTHTVEGPVVVSSSSPSSPRNTRASAPAAGQDPGHDRAPSAGR